MKNMHTGHVEKMLNIINFIYFCLVNRGLI